MRRTATALAAILLAAQPALADDRDLLRQMEEAIAERDGTPLPEGAPADPPVMIEATPEAVFAAARTLGPAELGTDEVGDPMISGSVEGISYEVFFYDCEGGRDCGSILIGAGFDLEEPGALETVNAWNRQARYGRLYLDDEGDPILEFDIWLRGGVSPVNLEGVFARWRETLLGFASEIGF